MFSDSPRFHTGIQTCCETLLVKLLVRYRASIAFIGKQRFSYALSNKD